MCILFINAHTIMTHFVVSKGMESGGGGSDRGCVVLSQVDWMSAGGGGSHLAEGTVEFQYSCWLRYGQFGLPFTISSKGCYVRAC